MIEKFTTIYVNTYKKKQAFFQTDVKIYLLVVQVPLWRNNVWVPSSEALQVTGAAS